MTLKNLNLSLKTKPSLIIIILFVLSIQSCIKKPELIGEGVLPNKDLIEMRYTDTIGIVAYSIREDSIRTDEPEQMLLGSMKDPVFGTTVAGFYTQFQLSTGSHNFGTNPVLDSLVLQMAYSGYYGDTTTPQTVRVYELEQNIFVDSAYYSNTHKTTGNIDYSAYTFTPKPRKRVIVGRDTIASAVRIKLSNTSTALGNKILSATTEQLSSAEKFGELFKGLYITADQVTSNGAILYYFLPTDRTRLIIYYSNSTQDSLRYEFYCSNNAARFNTFDHFNYQDADPVFKSQVLQNDTLLGRNKLYLQGTSGIKSVIKFPGLAKFKDNVGGAKVVINEAKVVFSGREIDSVRYFPPGHLALVKSNGNGTYSILKDQLEGETYFGGKYIKASNQFQFRITRYIQDVVLRGQGKTDHGLNVFMVGSSSRANRWVFNGVQPTADTLKSLKLIVNYSLVKQ